MRPRFLLAFRRSTSALAAATSELAETDIARFNRMLNAQGLPPIISQP